MDNILQALNIGLSVVTIGILIMVLVRLDKKKESFRMYKPDDIYQEQDLD